MKLSRLALGSVALTLVAVGGWTFLKRSAVQTGTGTEAQQPLAQISQAAASAPATEQASDSKPVPSSGQSDSALSALPVGPGVPGREALAALWGKIPAGEFRNTLEVLDEATRYSALAKLSNFSIPKEDYSSLRASPDGELFYVCDLQPVAHEHEHDAAQAFRGAAKDGNPDVAAVSVPVSTPPVRHSKQGSTNVLYLDFSGHTVTGTSWNSSQPTFEALGYDTDGDPTTFSSSEQALIVQVWERVAEDFAPFDVDVTTEEPATFTGRTGRALITRSTDKNGVAMPSNGGGGVAYMGVFGNSNYATSTSPAFVYYDHLGTTSASNIAEAASHELGHNLGLSHDAQSGSSYYGGHGTGETSWGPIMGTGYGRNVSQWSKGEYYDANNLEDDLTIIKNRVGWRTDEAGGTVGSAGSLVLAGSSVSTTGVLATSADPDVFAFTTAAGPVSFTVSPYRAATGTYGGNADIKLELLDGSSTVVASSDPAATIGVTLNYTAGAGTYYLKLSSSSTGTPLIASPTGYTSYGSTGQYTITGTIIASKPSITSELTATVGAGHEFSYQIQGTNTPTSYSATGLPAGLSVDVNTGLITGNPTSVGLSNVTLGATNSLGTGTAALALTVTDAAPGILTLSAVRQVISPGDPLTLSVSGYSSTGSISYIWKRNGFVLAGATGSTYSVPSAAYSDSGYYQVSLVNSVGTTQADTIFVSVAPSVTQVVAWGDSSGGATTIPAGLGRVLSTSGGYSHAMALLADGSIAGWGNNDYGQRTLPSDLANVVELACGWYHGLALKADGTVAAWGPNWNGERDVPQGLTGVVKVAAGNRTSYALKSDGTVVAWGRNDLGQTSVPSGLSRVVSIVAGAYHALALRDDGTVVSWGQNDQGQATTPSGLSTGLSIGAGAYHSEALKVDGTLTYWGNNYYAKPPTGLSTVKGLSCGTYHTLAWKADGTVVSWGDNTYGQRSVPSGLGNVAYAGTGFYFSMAVRDASLDTVPVISTQPQSVTVYEGSTVNLSVTASGGTGYLLYQWRKGGVDISGATLSSLALLDVSQAAAGAYDVVITDSAGQTVSATANVGVQSLLSITADPLSITQTGGTNVSLSVTASGTGLTYQWYKDGVAITGATSSTLSLQNLTAGDAGDYTVVVSNGYSSVTSRAAHVTVGVPVPGRIKNMSVRSVAGYGGNPLIVGFVMSGGAKDVLVRATGPALAGFGVSGTLADPTVELHTSISGVDTVVASNDNWGSAGASTTLSPLFGTLGAFGLADTASLDSALVAACDGSRTVLVKGSAPQASGVVLVEVYDAGTGTSQRLINVSARNHAGSGSDTLIVGFVIDGNVPKKILIRGVGPTLGLVGVQGFLADPKLELHTTVNGLDTVVATNDNWESAEGAAAAATASGAFGLAAGSLDSALSLTLEPGAYTGVVTGADGGTGEVLVEVYEVP